MFLVNITLPTYHLSNSSVAFGTSMPSLSPKGMKINQRSQSTHTEQVVLPEAMTMSEKSSSPSGVTSPCGQLTNLETCQDLNRYKYHYESSGLQDLICKLGVKNSQMVPKVTSIILTSSVGEASGPINKYTTKSQPSKSKSSNKSERSDPIPKATPIYSLVGKALQLLVSQPVNERLYRISRPSLGVRAGKLAAYRLTLRNAEMYSFLDRFVSNIVAKQVADGTFKTILSIPCKGISSQAEKSSGSKSSFLNDGSLNKAVITTSFDGNGNYHCGVPSLFVFREVEQNPEFESLKSHGLNVTIQTTATTDHEAKLLLSS